MISVPLEKHLTKSFYLKTAEAEVDLSQLASRFLKNEFNLLSEMIKNWINDVIHHVIHHPVNAVINLATKSRTTCHWLVKLDTHWKFDIQLTLPDIPVDKQHLPAPKLMKQRWNTIMNLIRSAEMHFSDQMLISQVKSEAATS